MTEEQLRKALSKAWNLGQEYWRQADSDSYKQQDKSEVTRQSYLALVEETVAILQAATRDAPSADAILLAKAIERMNRARAILTEGEPRPNCNWGMLDTSDLIAASAPKEGGND